MDRLRSEALSTALENACPDPVDKGKVEGAIEQYKGLNRNEQILFLLSIGGCSKPSSLDLAKTTAWLKANFMEDCQVAIPKEDVYFLYTSHTTTAGLKPVSTADFGKIVRQVFPEVKARRLGQRGSSKYCYANIRRKTVPDEPVLPQIPPVELEPVEEKIIAWGTSAFGVPLKNLQEFAGVMGAHGARPVGKGQGSTLSRSPTPTLSTSSTLSTPRSISHRPPSLDDPELVHLQQKMPHLRQLLTTTSFIPLQHNKRRHVSAFPSSASSCPPPPLRSASVPVGENYGSDSSGFGSCGSTPRNPMLSSTADVFCGDPELDLFGELFGF